ncbi:MAG: hypothetical protein L3J47_00505 [Sulfurovum sp.]|nr:hypothetical protein [Sulfurovum sp.]
MPVRPMSMKHHNGSLTTAIVEVPVNRGSGQYVNIANLDAANTVEVSFNGGRSFFTILAGKSLVVNALFTSVHLRSDVTADYSAIFGEG